MKKLILIFLLLIPIVVAIEPQFTFRQGSVVDFRFGCFDDATGLPCDSLFLCNITVKYPNTSLMIDNKQTTRNDANYNISIPDVSVLGIHGYQSYCDNGTAGGFSEELSFLINTTGEDFSIQKSILYLFVLFLSLVVFGLSLFGAIKIKWDFKRNEEGRIVGMNDLKYVKMFLWFFTYLVAIFILFMGRAVSGLLEMQIAANFFKFLYLLSLGF